MTWEEFVLANIPNPYTVQLQLREGAGAYGDVHASAVSYGPCYVEQVGRAITIQTVEQQGEEHLSSTTVFGPPKPPVEPGSLVTVPWRTKPSRVLAVALLDDHGIGLPTHQELSLE